MIECETMKTPTTEIQVPDNIVLIGPMGAGKTTVGKQIAAQLEEEAKKVTSSMETTSRAIGIPNATAMRKS